MRVFYCTNFVGYNPVGTCAIIKAVSRVKAAQLLEQKLRDHKSWLVNQGTLAQKIKPAQMVELDLKGSEALILLDGDY
jgi:hypothetical protein